MNKKNLGSGDSDFQIIIMKKKCGPFILKNVSEVAQTLYLLEQRQDKVNF